ncbi:hypothetical protein I6I76_05570 [Dermacoccus nishinomiyaensis]|uniref:hypothetical protein n=1 Tax=Dermacoccus nishinomiyaensis TaxID=1274 RepID=UPI000DFFF04E|nr:hypothetical protein [Dermacoccus nishinomiyaensis]QQY25590.1 hypothetical protein I6I76_05570 [Dermacoccus nishinomiyaensis]STD17017.1 type VII secretion-associated protein, Rv3446c family [Dermacoccus nishinomiyaensis]
MVKQGPLDMTPRALRRSLRRAACGVAALVTATGLVALSACSSGADPKDVSATQTPFSASSSATTASSNPSAITSPSPGSVVSSDGAFNFVVPAGWNLTSQPKSVAYLSSSTLAHDVAPTIVVARSSVTPAPELAGTLRRASLQAKQSGASVAALPDRTVGGEKAVGFTATSTEKNVDLKRSYVMLAHDKVLYSVTLTGAKADAARDESALTALLASWSWTKKGDAGSTASGTTPAAVPTTSVAPSSSGASSSGASSAPASSSAASKRAQSWGTARPPSATASSTAR